MSCAWISGVGVVSALGGNAAETAAALFAPEPRLPELPRRVRTELSLPIFELPDPDDVPGSLGLPLKFLLRALKEALQSAGLTPEDLRKMRVGIAVGTTGGCQLDDISVHDRMRAGDWSDTGAVLRYLAGIPAEYLRRELCLSGPAVTVSNACSSGADAAVLALDWLKTDRCDLVIAAGCDSVSKVAFNGFNALRVCAPEPCRPFDADRRGLNLGDGAGVVILESPRSATARGVRPGFELSGAGKTADAFHITQPEPSGAELERAIRQALAEAGIAPEEIDFVNAHGTGTPVNDRVEGGTLARVFGSGLRYHSTKAMTGHTLGAAGAMELIFCKIMLEKGLAAPSCRYVTASEEIPVPPLTSPTPIPGRAALSTSLAFGGSNTALAIGCATPAEARGVVPVYLADALELPAGAPDREALMTLCRKYGLRRVDRLTQMMLAAADALAPALAGEGETGLLTVSAFGPSDTTDKVLDDILDFPEDEILPTGFSHSVANAAASYLSAALGIHGPTFALLGFEDPFFEAAELAETLISSGRCRRVLIVAGDEPCLTAQAAAKLRRSASPIAGSGAFGVVLTADPAAHGRLRLERGHGSAARRILPCGVPENFPGAVAAAGATDAVTLTRLDAPEWGS